MCRAPPSLAIVAEIRVVRGQGHSVRTYSRQGLGYPWHDAVAVVWAESLVNADRSCRTVCAKSLVKSEFSRCTTVPTPLLVELGVSSKLGGQVVLVAASVVVVVCGAYVGEADRSCRTTFRTRLAAGPSITSKLGERGTVGVPSNLGGRGTS